MLKKLVSTVVFSLVFSVFTAPNAFAADAVYSAADMKEAAKTYKMICLQCHGPDAMGKARLNKKTGKYLINAMAGPQLAGLNEAYALKQVIEIQKGIRKNANTISMKQKISKLTEKELAALAHYVGAEMKHKPGSHKGMLE